MWTKISTNEQLQNIGINTVIVKYPIDGEPLDRFDGANHDNVSPRVVVRNSVNEIDIAFIPEKIENDIILGLDQLIFGPIHKKYADIINEKIWWIDI